MNLLWAGASARAWQKYRAALRDPARAQLDLLAGYVQNNSETVVGRMRRFSRIVRTLQSADAGRATWQDVVDQYREHVPIASYDDLEPLVRRVARGEPGVLTQETVRRLAPSSGSTAAAKLLPGTIGLQREFSRAIDPWIVDLFRSRPSLAGGPAYWSITPALSADTIASARFGGDHVVPVGFEDDSAYLGVARRTLIRAVVAVPDDIRFVTDPDAFHYVTLLFLIRAQSLRLMSIWHPSFLSRLLDRLPTWWDRLIADVERGSLSPPGSIPADVRGRLLRRLTPDPRRAAALRRVGDLRPETLWRDLCLVSCWSDGPARSYAERLARELSGVPIQPKGLIATEAVVSIPFRGLHPIAIRSHFFEFLDASGRALLAHELERDVDYSVVITTAGGLYRYRLGDCVRVNAWIGDTPSLRFVGRADRVSDRFGEKLSDGFVTGVLATLFEGWTAPRFAMLAPESSGSGTSYTLLVEPDGVLPPGLETSLERELRRNLHYSWCVDLGQLRPSRVVSVGPGADRAYVDACVAKGQRLGDVKPVSLHRDSGWEVVLKP
jgi:hypothetical protein